MFGDCTISHAYEMAVGSFTWFDLVPYGLFLCGFLVVVGTLIWASRFDG